MQHCLLSLDATQLMLFDSEVSLIILINSQHLYVRTER